MAKSIFLYFHPRCGILVSRTGRRYVAEKRNRSLLRLGEHVMSFHVKFPLCCINAAISQRDEREWRGRRLVFNKIFRAVVYFGKHQEDARSL